MQSCRSLCCSGLRWGWPWRLDICWHPGFSNGAGFQSYIGGTIVSSSKERFTRRSIRSLSDIQRPEGPPQSSPGQSGGARPPSAALGCIPMNHWCPERARQPGQEVCCTPSGCPFVGGQRPRAPLRASPSTLPWAILSCPFRAAQMSILQSWPR